MRGHNGKSKAANQAIHARRRADERFSMELNRADMRNLAYAIQRQQTICVFRQSRRVSHHLIFFRGQLVKLVYDCKRSQVITFLYPSRADLATVSTLEAAVPAILPASAQPNAAPPLQDSRLVPY